MNGRTLADKAVDIAKNYKTLYIMGCFGAPMTAANKDRYTKNHSYNKAANRTKMINAATADTFGFDCVNLIKGILWGWSGDKGKTYGGASYTSNGVPDIGADGMIAMCKDVSANFSKIEVGEAVWMSGHIGIYIGDGLAVECSPKWENKVQITAVGNIGRKAGYNVRTWTKHGKIPWVDYSGQSGDGGGETAKLFDAAKAGTYTVTAGGGLNVRAGAGTDKAVLGTLAKGTRAVCDGHYGTAGGTDWLLVTSGNIKGYASAAYLKAETVPAVDGSNDNNTKEDDDMTYYKTLADVPAWYKPSVQKAVDKGALNGTGNGEINVSEDFCRTLTVLDRLGKLD